MTSQVIENRGKNLKEKRFQSYSLSLDRKQKRRIMAKQMSVMRFGKHQGLDVALVPTDYLVWIYGSFPKPRTKVIGILGGRGLSQNQISTLSGKHRVLGSVPRSNGRRSENSVQCGRRKRTNRRNKSEMAAQTRNQKTSGCQQFGVSSTFGKPGGA